MTKTVTIIPARLGSTRLPQKMLLSDTGMPLIVHTWMRASQSRLSSEVIVATDHEGIAAAVKQAGGQAVMTRSDHPSGTDRIVEVIQDRSDVELVVNLQGDEPEMPVEAIDRVIEAMVRDPALPMATVAVPLRDKKSFHDPACVKVVFDHSYRALYFSRSPIPYPRDWQDDYLLADPPPVYQHLGLYVYRRDLLLEIPRLPRPAFERIESLEQLRILNAGKTICVVLSDAATQGIDTPEDYAEFVKRWRQ